MRARFIDRKLGSGVAMTKETFNDDDTGIHLGGYPRCDGTVASGGVECGGSREGVAH